MAKYTALLNLPLDEIAEHGLSQIPDSKAMISEKTGIWLTWQTEADNDEDAEFALEEMRLRVEMTPEYANGEDTSTGLEHEYASLFMDTPFVIVRDDGTVIKSDAVICA